MNDFEKLFEQISGMSMDGKPVDKVEIRIVMTRELFSQIRSAVLARYISHGSINGLADSFLARFVEKVDAGQTEWEVKKK